MSSIDGSIIVRDPDVLGGTPVFAGTRVPVDTLLAHLKAGEPLEVFLKDFPTVTRDQAESAIGSAQPLPTVIEENVLESDD